MAQITLVNKEKVDSMSITSKTIRLTLISFVLAFGVLLSNLVYPSVDVTNDVELTRSSMRYDRRTGTSSLEITIKNTNTTPVFTSPLLVVIKNISNSNVTLENPDGQTRDGNSYIEYWNEEDVLLTGEKTEPKTLVFDNPGRTRFSYDLSVVASDPLFEIGLRVENPVAVVPATFNLLARVSGTDDTITEFQWDFGDGESRSGSQSEQHVYDKPGSYLVTVSATDSLGIRSQNSTVIDVAQNYATADALTTGANLQLGKFNIDVPQGVVTSNTLLEVFEVPSQVQQIDPSLDLLRFQPFGNLYRLVTPINSDIPLTLTLSYDKNDIPAGFSAANLAIISRSTNGIGSGIRGHAPSVKLTPLPATVDEAKQTVTFQVYGSATVQLAASSEPVEYVMPESNSAMTANTEQNDTMAADIMTTIPQFDFVANYIPSEITLDNWFSYLNEATEALHKAYDIFVTQQGYRAPKRVTVVFEKFPEYNNDSNGYVSFDSPRLIHINFESDNFPLIHDNSSFGHGISPSLKASLVHEYFHVLQFYNSNIASMQSFKNNWFIEGVADWAMDEVYDDTDAIHIVFPTRLRIPLNLPGNSQSYLYETHFFWKWLSSQSNTLGANPIKKIMDHHNLLTQFPFGIKNDIEVLFLDNLISLFPNLSYIDFAKAVLLDKNFDLNENKAGDLWSKESMGTLLSGITQSPVPDYFRKNRGDKTPSQLEIISGKAGESVNNPLMVDYTVWPYLSVDVRIIKANVSETGGTPEGDLHLLFKADKYTMDVTVIPFVNGAPQTIRNLTSGDEKEIIINDFKNTGEVVVILAYPGWTDLNDEEIIVVDKEKIWKKYIRNQFKAWVTPKVTIHPRSLHNGLKNTFFAQEFYLERKDGALISPVVWELVDGSLPEGIFFGPVGTLTGVPFIAGTFQFTIKATGSEGESDTVSLSLTINSERVDENEVPTENTENEKFIKLNYRAESVNAKVGSTWRNKICEKSASVNTIHPSDIFTAYVNTSFPDQRIVGCHGFDRLSVTDPVYDDRVYEDVQDTFFYDDFSGYWDLSDTLDFGGDAFYGSTQIVAHMSSTIRNSSDSTVINYIANFKQNSSCNTMIVPTPFYSSVDGHADASSSWEFFVPYHDLQFEFSGIETCSSENSDFILLYYDTTFPGFEYWKIHGSLCTGPILTGNLSPGRYTLQAWSSLTTPTRCKDEFQRELANHFTFTITPQ